jgi:peptide/nickel transport system ATP-binding protein
VADVNFNLNEGNTLAIVGRSGSGKSTLARLIVQLIIPDTGIVVVDGINLLTVRGTARRQSRRLIQMVFQDPFGALNPRHRIGDAIARSAMRGGADRNAARADAMALLNLVGLPPAAYDRYPVAFSGGQRQRIGIARALAIGPRVLICDESVSGLDPVVQAEVLELLETIQADTGLAILFITHDLRAAAAIADQVIVMDAGRIVEAGATGQVLSEPQSDAAKALVSALPVAHQSSL